jgi:hypothetical protein
LAKKCHPKKLRRHVLSAKLKWSLLVSRQFCSEGRSRLSHSRARSAVLPKSSGSSEVDNSSLLRTPSVVASVTRWARPYDKAFVRVAGSKRAQTGPPVKLARRTASIRRRISRPRPCALRSTPYVVLWASSSLPQSCPKNGDATRSVSATSLQLSESLRPNISDVRRSTANTPSWMRCSRISRKVAKVLY